MAVLAVILKVLGVLVTFISGLTALNYSTRDRDGLTTFGWIFLSALVIGIACSGGGVVLDWLVKKADDAKNEQQMHQLKVAADAARFTTADASVSITVSVDKSLPALKAVIARLDQALEYAKSHCRSPGDVAQCKDFIIRAVIIDELRFDEKSSLFPLASKDKQAAAIMNGLGVSVRFYNEKFVPSLNLGKNSSGGFFLTEKTISGTTLFEYDAFRLRWFIGGKLPPEAFKVAGILSIVDLLGKGATARPYASGQEVCPTESIEHDCDIYLRELLRATKIEDVEFRFPHRKNFRLPGIPENRAQDNVDVPHVFENFPSSVEEFKEE